MKPFMIIAALLLLLTGCKKDEDPQPPSVTLKTGSEYTPDGAIVAVGGPITLGITASTSGDNITNLVIKKVMPDGSVKVVLDSGMNSTGFSLNKTFYQSVEDEARWTVQIMDKNRLFATAAITIFRDPNSSWGGIFEYPYIIMGFQSNTEYGQFLNPATGKVWATDSATLSQTVIDIVTYYFDDDGTPSPTFSSPGEEGGGIYAYYPQLRDWTTLRSTKWDISVDANPIPVSTFDNCHNDSTLIVSYNDVWGKRKFKYADAGKVIPFLTASGKKGLIKVLTTHYGADGTIEFSLKIQR
jgi:hypothetical protein